MSLRHRLQAWGELLGRYRRAWAHAWSHRRELTPPAHTAEEAEFLPAALSLQARPVSPSGRWTARLLMLLVLALLAWSVIGRTDIVVNAQGRIVPRGQTKTLAAVETARVHALHVEEGRAVKAGDLLVELDTRLSDSEGRRAAQALAQAQAQVERATALLAALERPGAGAPRLAPLSALDPLQQRLAEQHLQDQWSEYRSRLARLEADAGRLAQALPLAEQRARDHAELLQSGDVSRHAWMEREQARVEIAGQLAVIRAQQLALTAEMRRTALYLTLAQVPAGTLISYGQLAALAGLGRAARWVGRTLSQLPADSSLPWHRVIAASGRLSLPADSPVGAEQRARLHAEGIDLTNDRVNLRIHGWRP